MMFCSHGMGKELRTVANQPVKISSLAPSQPSSRWMLAKKCALVTGRSKGIGKAVVEELASLGATVLTCSRNSTQISACVDEWRAQGLDVHGITADITVAEDREALVAKVRMLRLELIFCSRGEQVDNELLSA
ncbi:unnamed protein product [Choristocarpus tenellus]